jgi:hypothetical protein
MVALAVVLLVVVVLAARVLAYKAPTVLQQFHSKTLVVVAVVLVVRAQGVMAVSVFNP